MKVSTIARKILDKFDIRQVYAHCDIPCGIYDPHAAQLAAHTIFRMDMLIAQLQKPAAGAKPEELQEYIHKLSRLTQEKEEQGEILKNEVRILWGDYFKAEHVQKFPELHELVWKLMKGGSKGKQTTDIAAAEDIINDINKLAEIFWATKGIQTTKVKAPYPTEKELVVPKL